MFAVPALHGLDTQAWRQPVCTCRALRLTVVLEAVSVWENELEKLHPNHGEHGAEPGWKEGQGDFFGARSALSTKQQAYCPLAKGCLELTQTLDRLLSVLTCRRPFAFLRFIARD